MKKIITIIVFIIITYNSFAQLSIEANYGIGSYSLNDLRDMNAEILKNLPVQGKITDDFPMQPFYGIGIFYQTTDIISLGVTGYYNTTGSRISYKDYSGELKADNILTSWSPGIAVRFKLMDKRLNLYEETRISCAFSKLEMNEKVISYTDEMTFKSAGLQIEPKFKLTYDLSNMEFGINAGYLIDSGGKNRLVGDRDAILQFNNSKDPVKTNWSGVRLSASVSYLF
ncbi:MAG: hypothetical protein PHN68_08585 [Prolixibacteraceae bacterium]|nr:hypothetical protein [Prolixibacteraceae bacterium]MDD4756801.1 hypothetical protein [Prolixibacteraceae bacterium]NLO03440.1 hypothetical protein [Bacteroidales bacterium]